MKHCSIRTIFSFLFFCITQSVYCMENEDGFFSRLGKTLHSYTLYFPFCEAVELAERSNFSTRDCKIIKNYITEGANLNWEVGKNDETIFTLAIKHQKKDLFEFLLQRNANVNAEDNDGNTPLHVATLNWNIDCIKSLIKCGADVNKKNEEGYSPLALALCDKKTPVEVIKELCNTGASLITNYFGKIDFANYLHWIPEDNKKKNTAFHMAIATGPDSIKYLKSFITHTRFDSDNKSSKVVYFVLLVLNRWEQDFNKEKKNRLYIALPKEIKLLIFSKLLPTDLYPYKKLCKELLKNNYNHILLPQIYERVENIKQILSSPNYENKTALQYALERFAGNPEYLKKACPLLDGTVLEIDFEHFLAHFPDIVNSPLESDKDNLVRQMFDNCAQLFLE